MQAFKGGAEEEKFYLIIKAASDVLNESKDDFWEGAYTTAALGDMIYESNRAPLTNAIRKEIFRLAFSEIFNQSFVQVGTFEAYITVFKKIFGDDVVIEFVVPAAGKLNINIEAEGVELNNFVAREIVDNSYEYNKVTTQAGEYLLFQSIKGFTSQYELERMLFEMVPAGIFTTINLTLGGA